MSLHSDVDIAIIGAGAAGIGAARALECNGRSVLMLEARSAVSKDAGRVASAGATSFETRFALLRMRVLFRVFLCAFVKTWPPHPH